MPILSFALATRGSVQTVIQSLLVLEAVASYLKRVQITDQYHFGVLLGLSPTKLVVKVGYSLSERAALGQVGVILAQLFLILENTSKVYHHCLVQVKLFARVKE